MCVIMVEMLKYTRPCCNSCFAFSSVCIYGGGDRRAQIDSVNKGVEIVIG